MASGDDVDWKTLFAMSLRRPASASLALQHVLVDNGWSPDGWPIDFEPQPLMGCLVELHERMATRDSQQHAGKRNNRVGKRKLAEESGDEDRLAKVLFGTPGRRPRRREQGARDAEGGHAGDVSGADQK